MIVLSIIPAATLPVKLAAPMPSCTDAAAAAPPAAAAALAAASADTGNHNSFTAAATVEPQHDMENMPANVGNPAQALKWPGE
mgnify:CR=1 FL=1